MAEYTESELEALPQTETVFDQPKMIFGEHVWIQQGYEIIDACPSCPRYGVPIPIGTMLTKDEKGDYELVDEQTRLPYKK